MNSTPPSDEYRKAREQWISGMVRTIIGGLFPNRREAVPPNPIVKPRKKDDSADGGK